jgi:hypothetical protein
LHRLADSGAFDDDVFDFLGPGQTGQLRQQIAAQGAADAAILELDEFFLGLGDFVVGDQGGVDVEAVRSVKPCRQVDMMGDERAHIIDNDGNLEAMIGRFQNVL